MTDLVIFKNNLKLFLVSRHRLDVVIGSGSWVVSRQARAQRIATARTIVHDSALSAHDSAHSVHTLCTWQTYNSALYCALFGVTIHDHCSWGTV